MSFFSSHPEKIVAEKPLIWGAVIVVPIVLYFYLSHIGFPRDVAIFMAIVGVTLISWMFSLMADFIPALVAMLLVLLFGLAPQDIVLSGFSSNGFLIAFSVMGLGAIISSSGLANRYTIWLLKTIPANSFAYQVALFFTGLFLNPVVPTITGRAVIVGPILNNIVSSCSKKDKEKSSTMLYLSGLDSINFLSPLFLTAAPANLMVFALFPPQEQYAFSFVFWLYASSVAGLVMLVSYFVVSSLMFRSFSKVDINKDDFAKQWDDLSPLSWQEWAALISIVCLGLGILTASIHKIPLAAIAFTVICSLLVVGVLTRDEFVKRIDWAFLFLLASMIGVTGTMNYMGLDEKLIQQFAWLEHMMRSDFPLFVLACSMTVLVVRFFIPLNSAIVICAAALLPLASGAGISPWVVGFIILIMAETAFFGYQSPYILFFRNLVKNDVTYSEIKVQIFHGILVLVKLVAIYVSIPFWRSIGVL
ncbi:MAG: SLC13 family permease [Desulfotalea sp.]